ncbi:LacI family transcriptional regulator [Prevotella brunnea]|uniref:LacI family transcriptional regulator n=1 Tax=Prevotella brunnea TaxID=2508867 RepID=A0A5C8GLY7_9BACT|nr:LacI family DNA-binding transcriptional regulator [Prevotella brunnea]MDR0185082.1 LacI family transcriptional regulator [Prevotella brunnea]TXJ62810.1 LacI family transcriptional regulator [Prevotella brunnea]
MQEGGNLTMKDIARNLGVSVATVSRALKDSPRISSEKRAAIQRYAREHNFTPNLIAETLRKSKVQPLKIIGVIVPQFTHFYFSTVLAGIEEEASARGYRVMVAQSDERYEREVNICRSFYENKVCGVIVSQAKDTVKYDHFKHLMDQGVPLVFYDRISTGVNASRVVVDDYMGAFSAVTHLVDTGCRRIAFYGVSLNLEIGKNRYNGYRDALLKNGIQPNDQLIRMCDNRADAEAITPDMFTLQNPPDAFFAVNDDTAIGILYSCKRMGLRVPDDISICGFTNGVRATACDPMLTTVEQRGIRVGEEAANILIDKVEGALPMDSVEKRVVRTRLIVRGTSR